MTDMCPYRQIEIFAGVAASSMPTVRQFFVRQDFRVLATFFPEKEVATNELACDAPRMSAQKLTDDSKGFKQWGYKSNAETEFSRSACVNSFPSSASTNEARGDDTKSNNDSECGTSGTEMSEFVENIGGEHTSASAYCARQYGS
jgi:hypothetical protein